MANNKKSFIAYCDWGEIFDELEDDEAGRLAKHLFSYVRDENPTSEDKLTKMMFIQIKQSLKRDLVKYEKYTYKQSENGKKGGRPKKTDETQKTQPFLEKPKKAVSVNVSDSVNDNVINKKEEDLKSFDFFWDHFHVTTQKKKENRDSAFKHWVKLTLEERRIAYKRVLNYSKSVEEKKFLVIARTYLSDKRFNDEFTEVKMQEFDKMNKDIVPTFMKKPVFHFTNGWVDLG